MQVRTKLNRLSKRSKYLPQGIATTITVAIISIIILAPSALAVSVQIQGLSDDQEIGLGTTSIHGSYTFFMKVVIDSDERVPLENVAIILDDTTYNFNANTGGTNSIMSVTPYSFTSGQLWTSAYGYGYYTLQAYSYSYSTNYYGSPSYTGYSLAGPQTLTYKIIIDTYELGSGDHTIRLDAITTGLVMNTYSSTETDFTIISGSSDSATVAVGGSTVDHTTTTGTKVVLTGVTLTDSSLPGTITTQKFVTAPTTSISVATGTGKTSALFVDVKAFNMAGGTATITITYTDADIVGLDESTLTIYYWSGTAWESFTSIVRSPSTNTITGNILVINLDGTYVSLAGTAPVTPPVTPPAAGPGPALPGVSANVNTNLRLVSLQVAPGSPITISITLTSNTLMTSGSMTLTLPANLRYSDLRTINFDGTSTLTGNTLVLERIGATGSNTATIFLKLTAPLDSSIKVGETYTVTVNEVVMQGMTVSFSTPQTVTFNIVEPTVQNIYSALDSHFSSIPSPYTENRVPTMTDIMNLLDFRLTGEVQP